MTYKSRKHRESQTRWTLRGPHQNTTQWKYQELKTEQNLKVARKKAVIYKGSPWNKTVSWILNRNCKGQKVVAWNIQSDEKQRPVTKQSYHLEYKER